MMPGSNPPPPARVSLDARLFKDRVREIGRIQTTIAMLDMVNKTFDQISVVNGGDVSLNKFIFSTGEKIRAEIQKQLRKYDAARARVGIC